MWILECLSVCRICICAGSYLNAQNDSSFFTNVLNNFMKLFLFCTEPSSTFHPEIEILFICPQVVPNLHTKEEILWLVHNIPSLLKSYDSIVWGTKQNLCNYRPKTSVFAAFSYNLNASVNEIWKQSITYFCLFLILIIVWVGI